MTLPADLARPLGRYVGRYQRALAVRGGLVAALSAGVIVALAWKLERFGVGTAWRQGLLLGGAVLIALSVGRWWRHRRLRIPAGCVQLDRSLRLQERLTTAEQFAAAEPAPALYPALIQDAARALSATRVPAAPTPITRSAIAFAIILLLILLWPRAMPLRLAGLPKPPTGASQVPPPTPPPPSPQTQQQERQQQQQGGGGEQDQPQPSAGGDESHEGGPDASKRQEDRGQERGDQDQSQGSGRGGEAQARGDAQEQGGDAEGQERGDRETRAKQARRDGEAGGEQPGEGDTGEQPSRQRESAARGREPREGPTAEELEARAREWAKAQETQRQAGQAGGDATGQGQEALKSEIQELLRELSGELEHLQDRLTQSDAQGPLPGTETDPELYGAPELPEAPGARAAPIQLQTDVGETAGQRRGGGVGKPSGEIDTALPELQPETAELSASREEVASIERQTVPPPYRNVFDRLFHRPTTQEQGTP